MVHKGADQVSAAANVTTVTTVIVVTVSVKEDGNADDDGTVF